MTKLLQKNGVVIALALVAVAVVYFRVIAPLTEGDVVEEDVAVIVDDFGDESFGLVESTDSDEVGRGLMSAQFDVGHFRATDLHWNEQPERDPFSPHVQINQNDVNAVLDKVKAPIRRISRSVRAALPIVSAIVSSERFSFAVINGEILKVGERIDDYVLRGIEHHSVTLQRSSTLQTFKVMVTE